MIFQHTTDQVLSNEKTQTRRIVKAGEYLLNGMVMTADGRIKWRVGYDYAVQRGRGQKAVARIIITDIRKEFLPFISDSDVVKEGFVDRAAFFQAWHKMHESEDHQVWVITFKLIQASVKVADIPCLGCGAPMTSYKLDFCYDCTMEQFFEADHLVESGGGQ